MDVFSDIPVFGYIIWFINSIGSAVQCTTYRAKKMLPLIYNSSDLVICEMDGVNLLNITIGTKDTGSVGILEVDKASVAVEDFSILQV